MAAAGMRPHTAVAIVSAMVEARIATRVGQCDRDRELLLLLSRLDGAGTEVPASKVATAVTVSGKRPAAGTIPGRVLDIVGEFDEPVSMRDILGAKHGAKEHHITSAVTQLVRAGHLVATGGTSKRRYSLPVKTKGGR